MLTLQFKQFLFASLYKREIATPDPLLVHFQIFGDRHFWYLFFETVFSCLYRYHFQYSQHLIVFYWVFPHFPVFVCTCMCSYRLNFLFFQQVVTVHLLCVPGTFFALGKGEQVRSGPGHG